MNSVAEFDINYDPKLVKGQTAKIQHRSQYKKFWKYNR